MVASFHPEGNEGRRREFEGGTWERWFPLKDPPPAAVMV
jgi:hypothetical protein